MSPSNIVLTADLQSWATEQDVQTATRRFTSYQTPVKRILCWARTRGWVVPDTLEAGNVEQWGALRDCFIRDTGAKRAEGVQNFRALILWALAGSSGFNETKLGCPSKPATGCHVVRVMNSEELGSIR